MKSLLPTLCAATLFLSTQLLAEDVAPKTKPAGDPAKRGENMKKMAENPKFIERFDTDGDGVLNEAEKAKAREAMKENGAPQPGKMREEALKRFDKNSDGKLDESERKAMEDDMRANLDQRPEMKKRLDTDNDGKISDAEWEAGRAKLRERMGHGPKAAE